jgi:flavin reductase (DIM6/NTAB) family NADH-FMN oxidoreductase RutF
MGVATLLDGGATSGSADGADPERSVTADVYRSLFRGHPAGVAVVTATTPAGPVALTATSVVSVSADPPTLIFSLSTSSSAAPGIAGSDTVVVHLLAHTDVGLARLCATSGIDRFADPSLWSSLPTGEPLFHGVEAWMRCRIEQRMSIGGSTVLAVRVVEASGGRSDHLAPLVYHDRTWHRLGEHSELK